MRAWEYSWLLGVPVQGGYVFWSVSRDDVTCSYFIVQINTLYKLHLLCSGYAITNMFCCSICITYFEAVNITQL